MAKLKYGVYRIRDQFYVSYTPVVRDGNPVQFKTEKEAETWLNMNPPKSTAQNKPTFEVRRIIKDV
jgi:hypothetical protein